MVVPSVLTSEGASKYLDRAGRARRLLPFWCHERPNERIWIHLPFNGRSERGIIDAKTKAEVLID